MSANTIRLHRLLRATPERIDLLAVHDGLPRGVAPGDNETDWQMALAKPAALVETDTGARPPA